MRKRSGFAAPVALLLALLFVPFRGEAAKAPPPSPAPRRVVSLAPSLTEFAFALNAGGLLVGATSYCNHPAAAKKVPRIGGMEDGSINFEQVLGLRPDLVLAIGEGQGLAVERLRRLGLKVEVVPSQTVEDVFRALPLLGRLLGRPAEAARLAADLQARVTRVREAIGPLPLNRRPRVFFKIWSRPLMTATRNTLAGQLIELAGGVNVFGEVAGSYPQVSPEAVLRRRPELIVIPNHYEDRGSPRSRVEGTGLESAEAVRAGRILLIQGDMISRAGPRVAEALELLAHELHPGLVPAPQGNRAGGGS